RPARAREAPAGLFEPAVEELPAGEPAPTAAQEARQLEEIRGERLLGVVERRGVERRSVARAHEHRRVGDRRRLLDRPVRADPLAIARHDPDDGEVRAHLPPDAPAELWPV